VKENKLKQDESIPAEQAVGWHFTMVSTSSYPLLPVPATLSLGVYDWAKKGIDRF